MDEKNQDSITTVWFEMTWIDKRLEWNPGINHYLFNYKLDFNLKFKYDYDEVIELTIPGI